MSIEQTDEGLLDTSKNRILAVDPHGHLTAIPRKIKMKAGWRLATLDDVEHASELERIRAAAEKAAADAAAAAALAAQEEADALADEAGGPLKG